MEHYYTPKELILKDTLTIADNEAKHLAKVLRKEPGAYIYVTDGECNLYKCRIEKILKSEIECSIEEKIFDEAENRIKITLYQSLLKNPNRFEFAIEKSVELGVFFIQPVITEHVINKERNKVERWNSISLSAMKQSGRTYLPKVNAPLSFVEAIKHCKDELKLIAHEKDHGSSISDCRNKNANSIALFIGPEGGFSDDEVELAEENGFNTITLGKRKFRSETAALSGVYSLLFT
jgi:16S rRNA (uracil1498-N3)-methyltransferase